MIFTWRGVKRLPWTGPSSSAKGAIHFLTVFVFDDLEDMRVLQGFAVDRGDGLLQCRIVEDTVLPTLNLVGGGEHTEVRGVGEKQRRHGGEAVSDGYQVAVVLPARDQHGADGRIRRVGDVDAAVVAHQEAVLEQLAHAAELFQLAHHDAAPANVGGDALRVVGMHERKVLPLVFVRRHDKHPTLGLQGAANEATDLRGLAGTWLAHKDHLHHLAGLSPGLGPRGLGGGCRGLLWEARIRD